METAKKDMLNKVPAITLLFWLTKLISTGLGESVSDFSSQIFGQANANLGELFTVGWSLGLFAIFITMQVKSNRYRPFFYWMSIALLAVFGTFSADTFKSLTNLHYLETTLIFGGLTIAGFIGWYFSTRDLSIHRIVTIRKELFYWLTVAFSFMLGTAAGDWMATANAGGFNADPTGLGLGFLNTGLILGVIFLAILAYRQFSHPKINGIGEITSFWLAYVLTRPIGASFADYFGYKFNGGFLGNQGMSLIWIFLFTICLTIIIVHEATASRTTKMQSETPSHKLNIS